MHRTTWALALLALMGLLVTAAAVGIAGKPMDGVGTAGVFTALWAGFVLLARAV